MNFSYQTHIDGYKANLTRMAQEKDSLLKHLKNFQDIVVQLRLKAISILERMDGDRRKVDYSRKEFQDVMRVLIQRVKHLVADVKALDALFTEPPTRNYTQYVKAPPVAPSRLGRAPSPTASDESDG